MIIPIDEPLQPVVEKYEGDQREGTDFEELHDNFKIVEQLALDHFNAIQQKA